MLWFTKDLGKFRGSREILDKPLTLFRLQSPSLLNEGVGTAH